MVNFRVPPFSIHPPLHVFSNAKSRTIGSLGTCSVTTAGGDEGPADALPEATAVDGLGVRGETEEELSDWTGGRSGGVVTATPMSWGWGAGALFVQNGQSIFSTSS